MARAPLELLPGHVAGGILRFLVDAVALPRYRATSRALRGMFDDDEAEPLWKACCVWKGWGFATPDGPHVPHPRFHCYARHYVHR